MEKQETSTSLDACTYYTASSSHNVLGTHEVLVTSFSPLAKSTLTTLLKNLKAPDDSTVIITKLQKQGDQMFQESYETSSVHD